ncbi:MAG: hypothetical protein ACP5JR_01770 [Thermoplasmata archaeon]
MKEQENTQSSTGFIGLRLQEEHMQMLLALREIYGLSISDAIRFCIEFTFEKHNRAFSLPDRDIQNLEKLVASGRFEDTEKAFSEIFHMGWEAYTDRMISKEKAVENILDTEIKERLAEKKNEELARKVRRK